MSIREMRHYVDLCAQGQASIPQRKAVLAEKRTALLARISELEDAVRYIDWKQGFYENVLAGRTPYVSNLLPDEDQ